MYEFKERNSAVRDNLFNSRISRTEGSIFSLNFDVSRLKSKDDLMDGRITKLERKFNYLMDVFISLVILLIIIGLLILNMEK